MGDRRTGGREERKRENGDGRPEMGDRRWETGEQEEGRKGEGRREKGEGRREKGRWTIRSVKELGFTQKKLQALHSNYPI